MHWEEKRRESIYSWTKKRNLDSFRQLFDIIHEEPTLGL